MAIDAAIAGLGVAITPRPFVEGELAARRLVVPFDRALPSGRAYFLVYPEPRAKDGKVAAFRDWILGEFTDNKKKSNHRGTEARSRKGGWNMRAPKARKP